MTLAEAIVAYLKERRAYASTPHALDDYARGKIEDIDVHWSDGYNYDPTYGSEQGTPTLEVNVTFRMPEGHTVSCELDASWAMTALFRLALGLEQKP